MRSVRPAHVNVFSRDGFRHAIHVIVAHVDLLRIDAVRVGVAVLYVVLMFITVYAEASIGWHDGFLLWHVLFIIYETASLCVAAVWPKIGSWTVVGIWGISTLVPMSTTFPVSAPFAVAVLGAYRLGWGLAAGIICAGCRLLSFVLRIEPWPGSSGVAVLCGMFCLAACAGAVLNGMNERIRIRERRRVTQRNQAVVAQLHDRVCNTLSYLICAIDDGVLRVEHSGAEGLDNDGLRTTLEDALRDSRAAIALIRRNGDDDGDRQRCTDSHGEERRFPWSFVKGETTLAYAARNLQRRLGTAGVSGDVFVDPAVDAMVDKGTCQLVVGFLEELFGDIDKYADRTARYVVSIGVRSGNVCVDASDVTRPDRSFDVDSLSAGSGLAHYRAMAERRGGTLTVTEIDGIWSLHSSWPNGCLGAEENY